MPLIIYAIACTQFATNPPIIKWIETDSAAPGQIFEQPLTSHTRLADNLPPHSPDHPFWWAGGSRVHPYRSIYEWHRSYYLYYRKNLASDYIFLFNWFYYFLMGLKLVVSLIANALRTDKFTGPRCT
jgi:hypothetical protein